MLEAGRVARGHLSCGQSTPSGSRRVLEREPGDGPVARRRAAGRALGAGPFGKQHVVMRMWRQVQRMVGSCAPALWGQLFGGRGDAGQPGGARVLLNWWGLAAPQVKGPFLSLSPVAVGRETHPASCSLSVTLHFKTPASKTILMIPGEGA